MELGEAREHLEMVDRIVAEAARPRAFPYGPLLIGMGLGAALIDVGGQLGIRAGSNAPFIAGAVLVALS